GEAFGELRVPLLSNEPLAKDLSLDLGERYSHYNLFGGENTWKMGLSWQVNDALMFRGGFNRAIRAPSLQELYNPVVQAQDSINGDPCEVGSPQRSASMRRWRVTSACPLTTTTPRSRARSQA